MEKFGHYLKAHRESKGIRLEEISSITKIHIHSLQLIEEDDWDSLPPEPFVRGFIVAYAKYIGLNQKEVIQKYVELVKGQIAALPVSPTTELPPTPTPSHSAHQAIPTSYNPEKLIDKPRTLPLKPIGYGVAGLAVISILVTIMYLGRQSQQPLESVAMEAAAETAPTANALVELAKSNESDKKQERQPATADSKSEVTPAAAATTVVTEDSNHVLEVTSKDRTWIKVVIDEAPPIEYFLGAGQKASYSAKQKIKVVLGNSSGSQVIHNGQEAPGVKFQGTIRFYIFPSDARFPQDVPKRAITAEEAAQQESKDSDEN